MPKGPENLDPIAYRIEAGANISENPELGANVGEVQDREPVKVTKKLSAGHLAAIAAVSLVPQPEQHPTVTTTVQHQQ